MPTKEFEEYTIACGIGNEEKITHVAISECLAEGVKLMPCDLSRSDSLTVPINDWNISITGASNFYEPRPRRLRCEYCGCVSGKDFGTCEHCGAPLVPMEYYI